METADFLKKARQIYQEIVEEEKLLAEVTAQIATLKRQQRDLYNTYLQAYKECPSDNKTPVTYLEETVLKRYNKVFYRPDLSELKRDCDNTALDGYIKFTPQDAWDF